MNATDQTRRELLDMLAKAPDDVIARHAGIVRNALGCPEWCVSPHGIEEFDSLTSHHSQDVEVGHEEGGATNLVRLVVEHEGVFGDGIVRVAVDGDTYSAAEARELACVLVEHAARIDGAS